MCRRLFQLEVLACTLIKDSNIIIFKPKKANIICGVVYREHNSPEHFQEYFDETIEKIRASGKKIVFMGDTN